MDDKPHLTSRMLVDAMMRRVQQAGGFATVVQCGNDTAGAIVIQCCERGETVEILEKSTDFEGTQQWRRIVQSDAATAKWPDEYRVRRVAGDPDIWWIELDIAGAARFADEILAPR